MHVDQGDNAYVQPNETATKATINKHASCIIQQRQSINDHTSFSNYNQSINHTHQRAFIRKQSSNNCHRSLMQMRWQCTWMLCVSVCVSYCWKHQHTHIHTTDASYTSCPEWADVDDVCRDRRHTHLGHLHPYPNNNKQNTTSSSWVPSPTNTSIYIHLHHGFRGQQTKNDEDEEVERGTVRDEEEGRGEYNATAVYKSKDEWMNEWVKTRVDTCTLHQYKRYINQTNNTAEWTNEHEERRRKWERKKDKQHIQHTHKTMYHNEERMNEWRRNMQVVVLDETALPLTQP